MRGGGWVITVVKIERGTCVYKGIYLWLLGFSTTSPSHVGCEARARMSMSGSGPGPGPGSGWGWGSGVWDSRRPGVSRLGSQGVGNWLTERPGRYYMYDFYI